jgi:hypothetical protein
MKINKNDFLIIVKTIFNNISGLKKAYREKFVIITAADEQHYLYLESLINNYQKLYKKLYFEKLIVFDIGLNFNQKNIISKKSFVDLRKFSFEEYPDYYSSRFSQHGYKIGGFAWKPEMISIVKNENINKIIWLDSACKFNRKIILFKLLTLQRGFASFNSTGVIKNWTHSNVIKELSIENEKKLLNSSNLLAGVVGFNFKNLDANNIHESWNALASKKNMIFPKNSSSSNHRHDQSLLSICYWRKTTKKLPTNSGLFGITIQNWPNKILFFFEGEGKIKEKLIKKYYFQSTTTNSRCKIIILLNSNSIKKIPFRLIFTKKIILFIASEDQYKVYKKYLIKKRFMKVFIDISCKETNQKYEQIIDYEYKEIDRIIENEYRLNFNEK